VWTRGTTSWRYRTGPPGQLSGPLAARRLLDMKKRIFAAFLWFYTGWYGGALLADFTGMSPLIGPVIGAVIAALVVGDPRRVIWKARDLAPIASASSLGSNDDTVVTSI
jgi:hypothetical protein